MLLAIVILLLGTALAFATRHPIVGTFLLLALIVAL